MPERDEYVPLRVHPGGLMRCCLETWSTVAPPAIKTSEGDTLACNWCSSSMVVKDGVWQWVGPTHSPLSRDGDSDDG